MTGLRTPHYIQAITPYVPGKPIEETQREFGIERVIKLASNENPLGPSPRALEAIARTGAELHRYPDGSAYRLKRKLCSKFGLEPSQIIVGNGSNEVIDTIVRTFCVADDAIVTSKAAFIAYSICAQAHGVRTLESRLGEGYRFDLDEMLSLVRGDDRVRLVFLPNPNNPTGTYVGEPELRAFLSEVAKIRDGSVGVVLDYAYWEYVTAPDLPDPLTLMREFRNVIVLRTFSKIHGLAGLRIGYGVAAPEIIASLDKIRQPFNINSLALVGAEAALDDDDFVRRSREVNAEGMRYWEEQLARLGIPFTPSQGNFILADAFGGFGRSGGEIYSACLRRGVIFRPVANYGLGRELRISIGTPDENRIAVEALEKEKK